MNLWLLLAFLVELSNGSTKKKLFNLYEDSSGHHQIRKFYLKSAIACATACHLNPICNGVTTTTTEPKDCLKPRHDDQCTILCTILSDYNAGQNASKTADTSNIRPRTYFSDDCTHREAACQANRCQNSATCVTNTATGTGCWKQPYSCRCDKNHRGPLCESCAEGLTGKNCSVDISGTRFIDGIYFYVHGNVHNGTDLNPGLRPDCHVSRSSCHARNMTLLTIKNAAKNATVASLHLEDHACTVCFYQLGIQLSMTDNVTWVWDDDHQPLDRAFVPWYPGQPDTYLSSRNAAFLPTSRYSWSDVHCEFPAYYICEYVP